MATRPTKADTAAAFAAANLPAALDVYDPEDAPTAALQRATPDEDAEADLGDRIRAMLAAAPGDRITIKLYRLDRTGKREFCSNYSADEFETGDLEMIRDDWGAGSFEIRAIGSRGLITRSAFSIAEKRGVNPIAAPKQDGELSQMLRLLIENQNAMMARLNDRPDPTAEMTKTIGMMAAMRDAMGLNAAPAPAVPVQSASAALKEMLEVQALLKNAAGDVAPKSESDGLMEALTPILGVVTEAMKNQRAPAAAINVGVPMIQAPASLGAATAQPNAQPDAQQETQPEPETDEMNVFQQIMLKKIIQKLLVMATEKKTANEAADYILTLPDQVIDFLDMPDWFDALAEFAPDLRAHRAWLEAARAEVIKRVDAEDESTD